MSKASALGMTMDCLCLSYRWKQPVIPAVRRYPFVMPLKALRHTVENNRHTVENNRHAGLDPVSRGLRSKLLLICESDGWFCSWMPGQARQDKMRFVTPALRRYPEAYAVSYF
ncbi:MAG: hypothetical protein ACJA0N_000069 [Pseudohongiellaceae bacterium]|jgi:hypothetical protein